MQLQDSDVLVKANVEVGELALTSEDTFDFLEQHGVDEVYQLMDFDDPEYNQLFEELMIAPKISETVHELDLTGNIKPFNAEAKGLVVTEDGELLDMDEYSSTTSYGSSVNWNNITRYYVADPIEHEQTENGLRVEQLGEENNIPVYRSIEERGMSIRDADQDYETLDIMTDAVGYYQIADREESLSSSPLGIYQLEPIKYIDDSDEEITLSPTFTAGSFVTAPAEGVTNMESAEFIKGENPIDAIRVKVSGFNDYSPEAAKEIENIANDLSAMGLHVDIVAGSSLQNIDVEVEGIGTVQESWTTLGASGEIVGQWDVTNLMLAVIFTIVSMVYVVNRMNTWSAVRIEDIELYKMLGWNYQDIKKLYRKEIISILVTAIILSLIIVASLMFTNEQYFQLLFIQEIVITVLVVIILLLVEKRLNSILNKKGKREIPKVKETSSLVVRNIMYYRKSIFSTFLQILLVSSLISVVYLSLTTSVNQSNYTVLGQYVNAGVSEWNQLIIISTVILTMITLVENISAMLINRKEEINNFKILGWNYSSINKMYIKEISLWAGVAVGIGSIISFILFFSFYPDNFGSFLLISLTAIGLYLLIFIVSYVILNQRLKKTES